MYNKLAYEKLLKERNEREDKYFHVNDKYFPKYKEPPLTAKFYSKYEAIDLSKANPILTDTIKTYLDKAPKDKYSWPVTENQRYGWFTIPLVSIDKEDKRFYHPSKVSNMTKHEMKLKMDRNMQLPKFTGITWK